MRGGSSDSHWTGNSGRSFFRGSTGRSSPNNAMPCRLNQNHAYRPTSSSTCGKSGDTPLRRYTMRQNVGCRFDESKREVRKYWRSSVSATSDASHNHGAQSRHGVILPAASFDDDAETTGSEQFSQQPRNPESTSVTTATDTDTADRIPRSSPRPISKLRASVIPR